MVSLPQDLAKKQPINSIQWKEVAKLRPNAWNPNVVLKAEMKLLKVSLLKNGWIQPLLVDQSGIIIDGFHRYWLSVEDKEIKETFKGLVPCAVLKLTVPERMLLTVRINRAKGSHISVKMHDLISEVYYKHELTKERIAEEIGGSIEEVELLLQENVFKALDIAAHKYSMAWVPKK